MLIMLIRIFRGTQALAPNFRKGIKPGACVVKGRTTPGTLRGTDDAVSLAFLVYLEDAQVRGLPLTG